MAEEAKCALVIVDLEAEKCISVDVFTDDGEGPDPRWSCELLWKSVQDDWPTCQPAYVSNDAADELAKQRRLWQIGMKDDAPDMAPRIEAVNAKVAARD
jgi:hypothetical protein